MEELMFQKHIKPKCYLSILVFLFCTLLCFPQTKKEVKQWEKLQKKVNKFGHYEKKLTLLNDFIQKYPNHFYLEKANSQIEGIVYEQTKRKNTLEVYRDYLEKYPKGKNATEANEKVIDFVFKETKKKKKIEAYKKFLELYPDSKYTAEVKKKLEEMEEAKRIKFKVFSEQIIRGKNSDIVVEGKKLDAIDSVKIIPPEGIFVKGIKPGILNQKEKEMGQKRWLITLFAEKNSALSKRTLVLNTPNGLTKKNTIEIVSYLPIISNLRWKSYKI